MKKVCRTTRGSSGECSKRGIKVRGESLEIEVRRMSLEIELRKKKTNKKEKDWLTD